MAASITDLPPELVLIIISYLDTIEDALSLSRTCHRLRDIISNTAGLEMAQLFRRPGAFPGHADALLAARARSYPASQLKAMVTADEASGTFENAPTLDFILTGLGKGPPTIQEYEHVSHLRAIVLCWVHVLQAMPREGDAFWEVHREEYGAGPAHWWDPLLGPIGNDQVTPYADPAVLHGSAYRYMLFSALFSAAAFPQMPAGPPLPDNLPADAIRGGFCSLLSGNAAARACLKGLYGGFVEYLLAAQPSEATLGDFDPAHPDAVIPRGLAGEMGPLRNLLTLWTSVEGFLRKLPDVVAARRGIPFASERQYLAAPTAPSADGIHLAVTLADPYGGAPIAYVVTLGNPPHASAYPPPPSAPPPVDTRPLLRREHRLPARVPPAFRLAETHMRPRTRSPIELWLKDDLGYVTYFMEADWDGWQFYWYLFPMSMMRIAESWDFRHDGDGDAAVEAVEGVEVVQWGEHDSDWEPADGDILDLLGPVWWLMMFR
ncbi:hypothetical protein DFH27DRAFT_652155 [Peziza echinospora]|nr:hypothetical protein DFH27DRAFT_652155 [Peziza echinospora]